MTCFCTNWIPLSTQFDDHDFDLEVDPLVPGKGVQTVATMHSTVLPVQVTISQCLVHPLSKI